MTIVEVSEYECVFIIGENTDDEPIIDSICGDTATAIHAINLIDMETSIAVPTCEYHDGVMNGTVILRDSE